MKKIKAKHSKKAQVIAYLLAALVALSLTPAMAFAGEPAADSDAQPISTAYDLRKAARFGGEYYLEKDILLDGNRDTDFINEYATGGIYFTGGWTTLDVGGDPNFSKFILHGNGNKITVTYNPDCYGGITIFKANGTENNHKEVALDNLEVVSGTPVFADRSSYFDVKITNCILDCNEKDAKSILLWDAFNIDVTVENSTLKHHWTDETWILVDNAKNTIGNNTFRLVDNIYLGTNNRGGGNTADENLVRYYHSEGHAIVKDDKSNGIGDISFASSPTLSGAAPDPIWLYKGDTLPAPPEIYEQEGEYTWKADATATDGKQYVTFAPTNPDYTDAEFPVEVYVRDKTALDEYIKSAEFIRDWAQEKTGDKGGAIKQDAIDTLEAAITAANAVAIKAAKDNEQDDIDSALAALKTAVDELNINIPEEIIVTGPAIIVTGPTITVTGPTIIVTVPQVTAPGKVNTSPKQDPTTLLPNVTKVRTPLKTIYLTKKSSYRIPYVFDTAGGKTIKDAGLKITSSKPDVVKAYKSGKIKALKRGNATITIQAQNGKKAVIKIVVQKKKVALKKFTVKMPKKLGKDKAYQIKILKRTKKASNISAVTFKSSNKKVATVDKAGKITAKKKGKVKITIKVGTKKITKTLRVR